MKRMMILLSLFALMFSIQISAAEKMQIAVLELQPKGVSKIVAGAVSDIIRSEMVKTGLFVVVERGQMDEILKEQGFQMTGCTDQSCAVKVGQLLSARKILIGEVNKIGKSFMITVRIVDVEKGTSDFAANEKAENEDSLDKAGAGITRKLADNIVEGNKDYFVERKSPAGYYMRSIVPGWGQIYADKPVKGSVFLGGFLLSAGYTAYSYLNFAKAVKDYDDVPRGSSQDVFDSKFDDKKKAGKMLFIAGGITATIYLVHWADVLFFSKPQFNDSRALLGNNYPVAIELNPVNDIAFNDSFSLSLSFKTKF